VPRGDSRLIASAARCRAVAFLRFGNGYCFRSRSMTVGAWMSGRSSWKLRATSSASVRLLATSAFTLGVFAIMLAVWLISH
jgi:hypothetical protein